MPSRTFALPSECDLQNISHLHAALRELADHAEPLFIDGQAVSRCDTAAAQLLVCLAADPKVTWRLSPALRNHLATLGLSLKELHHDP